MSKKKEEEDKDIRSFISKTVIGKHEGGFQKFKEDRGNFVNQKGKRTLIGTKFGISAPTLRSYYGRDITEDDMKNLKKEDAEKIYYKQYFKDSRINKLPKDKQKAVLDFYINSGPVAIKQIQRKAGVSADGVIGENTVKALSRLSNNDIVDSRVNLIKNSSKIDEKFKKGLVNRANSFRDLKLEEEEEDITIMERLLNRSRKE